MELIWGSSRRSRRRSLGIFDRPATIGPIVCEEPLMVIGVDYATNGRQGYACLLSDVPKAESNETQIKNFLADVVGDGCGHELGGWWSYYIIAIDDHTDDHSAMITPMITPLR